jgi:CRP-like cAMP-binding protein
MPVMELSEEVYTRLPEHSILRSLGKETLTELLKFAIRKRPRKRETLFQQGDPGDSLLIVLSGTLKAFVLSPNGKEIVLDYIGPGGLIGEIAVLDGKPRAASVAAVESSEVLVLQRRHLIPYLERHEGAALKMLEVLCQKLRSTDALLEDNTTLAMGPKLARGLLRLVADHGVEKEGGLGLSFRIKQSELGNYVALSRENVNRQLQEWAASGLIDLSRGQISVLDTEALSEIAENVE